MKLPTPLMIALGLVLAGPALAQGPAAPSAAVVASEQANVTAAQANVAAPAPGAFDTRQAATPTAAPTVRGPDATIGQPVDGGIGLQPQVTAIGRDAEWMHNAILMPLITVICLFVLGLLLWVVVRYNRRANTIPSKTSHNTVIEVIWTLVPVLILIAIAIPSISLLAAQYKPAGRDAITIKAIGNQWYWTYEYPDNGGFEIVSNMLTDEQAARAGEPRKLGVDNRMVVPVGTTVRLLTTSNDVIHAWGVPAFWVKMDAVPGRTNEATFRVDRPGLYYGQCYELCGARHSMMPIAVEAMPKAQFAAWVASKGGTYAGGSAESAAKAAAAQGTSPQVVSKVPSTGEAVNGPAVGGMNTTAPDEATVDATVSGTAARNTRSTNR